MVAFEPPATAPAWSVGAAARERLEAATTQPWAAADAVDLGVGQPDATLLPLAVFERAFAAGPLDSSAPLQYGHPNGDGALRLELSRFLTGAYRLPVDPEELLVTNGNSHGIDLACAVLAAEPQHRLRVSSIDIHVSFLRGARAGRFAAIATIVKSGRTIAFLKAELFDAKGDLVATAASSAHLAREHR